MKFKRYAFYSHPGLKDVIIRIVKDVGEEILVDWYHIHSSNPHIGPDYIRKDRIDDKWFEVVA